MYLIVSGELRARNLSSDGKETTLATLGVGDFFGEISLLDEGPRSADIIANTAAVVLKLSSDSFAKMRRDAPELGLHFMFALGRSASGKIRVLTKRYQDSVQFSRYALMP
jgi:CRP-like cAMP-binding protein